LEVVVEVLLELGTLRVLLVVQEVVQEQTVRQLILMEQELQVKEIEAELVGTDKHTGQQVAVVVVQEQ
jgi:hypothetical protein